ncbi:MAG: oxidoreductase [Actinomycetia bacterium]|nr:oxidoreductase [Actinomycetes bacterium]
MPKRLLLNAFTMNCVSHIVHGLWPHPDTRQTQYTDLETWVELAKLLERGKFDAVFLADVVGVYETYKGGRETAVREGLQIPVNDPSLLIPAMAYATEHLGFAFTQSILQEHPYNFARRVSTLDHLTKGRVGWNIVTSYLEGAGRNLGYGGLPPHTERYARAEEYVEVLYKLWEGSWEDDAVIADRARKIYADPSKIHDINHVGKYYDVAGPHLSEPSPQRTPFLFQAGSSDSGRNFAARNAEAVFLGALNPAGAAAQIADIRSRAQSFGRDPSDIAFFQGLVLIVGSTEAEVARKQAEYQEWISYDGFAAHLSGSIGIDLGAIDPDAPIGEVASNGVRGFFKGLIEAEPNKEWTFRELLEQRVWTQPIAGTPEQVADELQVWSDAGVDGINVMYVTTPGTFADVVDGLVPELQRRGLAQREYTPGTLREKVFAGRGPRLNDRHPSAGHRITGAKDREQLPVS